MAEQIIYPLGVILLFLVLAVWDAVWKGIAMWKCGRNNQLAWFIAILIINSVGILPIIYLLFFQKKSRLKEAKEIVEEKLVEIKNKFVKNINKASKKK